MHFFVRPATAFLLANIPIISDIFIVSHHKRLADSHHYEQNTPFFVSITFSKSTRVETHVKLREGFLRRLADTFFLFPTTGLRQILNFTLGLNILAKNQAQKLIIKFHDWLLTNDFKGVAEHSWYGFIGHFLFASIITLLRLSVVVPALALAVCVNIATTLFVSIGMPIYNLIFLSTKISWSKNSSTDEGERIEVALIEGLLQIPGYLALATPSIIKFLYLDTLTPSTKFHDEPTGSDEPPADDTYTYDNQKAITEDKTQKSVQIPVGKNRDTESISPTNTKRFSPTLSS